MTIRIVLSAMTLLASAGATTAFDFGGEAQVRVIDGPMIRRIISGAELTGINEFGNPYVYSFHTGGGVNAVAGKLKQYDDRGRWTVEGAKLCTIFELWQDGKKACYNVAYGEDRFVRFKDDGSVFQDSKIVRR